MTDHPGKKANESGSPGLRVLCTGDIMLDGEVERSILEGGPEYLLREVKGFFLEHNVVFANLECPLTSSREVVSKQKEEVKKPDGGVYESRYLRVDPDVITALKEGGINLVGVANNHVFDCGERGFLDTIDAASSSGIRVVGGGRSEKEAYSPAVFEQKGLSVAFLAFSAWSQEAKSDVPGVARADIRRMADLTLSAKGLADHVIVAVHAGLESVEYPRQLEMRHYRKLIDAGASVVFSHHPHVMRGWEQYRSGYVFYGLGNFVSWQRGEKYERGLLLSLVLNDNGSVEVEPIPTRIGDDFRPRILEGKDKAQALEYLEKLSDPLSNMKHPAWSEAREIESLAQVGMVFTYGLRSQARLALTRVHKLRGSHFKYLWLYMKTAFRDRLSRSGNSKRHSP
jgi:poly-gamma-glutamate synthesis protein (capsule biosynthesis protein)